MSRKCLLVMFAMLALVLALALSAQAAPVGRFLQLEGQVDLLKGGKLPAVAAKLTDPVEPKDVIRTKSKSRAQILFVDDTILTLAPESGVTVADFFYDGAKGQRRVLLQVLRGLAQTVVKRILNLQEPDFLMQTHTAVIGVRGTEWYTLLLPNCTNVYNTQGLVELSSSNRQVLGSLLLQTLKFSEVCRDQAPGPARDITSGILTMLRRMMQTGVTAIPPDLSGGERPFPGWDQPGPPEGVMGPCADPASGLASPEGDPQILGNRPGESAFFVGRGNDYPRRTAPRPRC